jgi:hypothetical protein
MALMSFLALQLSVAIFAMSGGQATAPAPAATGRISGRVAQDGANNPIAGARVVLISSGRATIGMPPPQVLTDQDGRFVFDKVAPGEYRLDAQKTGFAPLSEPGHGTTATVTAGQQLELDLHLQRGGVIAGTILDASGEPAADLRVMAMRRINGPGGTPQRLMPVPMQGPQQTNDIGEFRITGLASGDYIVAAVPQRGSPFGGPGMTPTATGTAAISTYYPGTIDQAAAHNVTVRAGETINNITFSIQSVPAFRVAGRVVDENGAPAAGAMVMLMGDRSASAFMGPMGHASTGDDGRFTIADVPSGTYRINASIPMMITGRGGAAGGVVGAGFSESFMSWSISGNGTAGATAAEQPVEVVVNGANVTGVRVVARRPAPR